MVIPFMGAWIETESEISTLWQHTSHPSWVRGLKQSGLGRTRRGSRRTLHGCV